MDELGPTGKYPNGKWNEYDEGEIKFAVGNVDGHVIIDFNSPVVWLCMPPEYAIALANALLDHAEKAKSD